MARSFLSHWLPHSQSSPACPTSFPISWIFFFYFAKLGSLIWIRISTRWCSLWRGSGKCSQRESSALSRCVFWKAMSVRAHVLFVVLLVFVPSSAYTFQGTMESTVQPLSWNSILFSLYQSIKGLSSTPWVDASEVLAFTLSFIVTFIEKLCRCSLKSHRVLQWW